MNFTGLIAQLERQKELIQQAIDALRQVEQIGVSLAAPRSNVAHPVSAVRLPGTGAGSMNLGEAAKNILRENGRPMTNAEIADVLVRNNFPSQTKNMPNNVGTALWRAVHLSKDTTIRRVGNTWELVEK